MATGELEKITINMALVNLGQIDLSAQEGFYQNRTDFIRTAIRNQLTAHAEAVRHRAASKTLVLGRSTTPPPTWRRCARLERRYRSRCWAW